MNKAKQDRRGFTLAETLLAIMILLIVAAIVAAGIPAARRAYEKTVLASNAELLMSTAITNLRNELGTARELDVSEDGETPSIVYYHSSRGAPSRIYLDDETGLMFERYYSADGLMADYEAVPLVPSKAATADLLVRCKAVRFTDGIVTFIGLSVDRSSGDKGLVTRDELSVRVIAEQPAP